MAATLTFDILARDKASKTLKNVGTASEKTAKKFDGLKTAAATAGIAAGVFLVKFGKDSVKAFTEAEAAQTKLQDAFKRFPKLADSNIQAFRDLNTELAKKTKFDDDAYASGQAVLAQFGLTGKQIKNITPLLGDYAAKTGRDIPTSAKILGKAFLGNTRALKDLGIAYKPTGDKAKDMARIQELVNQKVGGFAEKQGKTAAGQAAILSNQFGELQEEVGSKLVPALTKLAQIGLKVIAFVQRNSDVLLPLAGVIGTIVVALKAWRIAQALLNIVLATNPIVLIAAAIAGLVVGVIIAYKKFETFRNIVKGVFKVLANVVLTFVKVWLTIVKIWVGAWMTGVGLIIKGAAAAFGWVPGIGGKLRKASDKFQTFRKGVNDQFDKVIDKVDQMQRKVNKTHGKTIKITVEMKMKNRLKISAAQGGTTLLLSGKPMYLARGGPIRGPGTSTSDSVPVMGSTGEYVIKASSARKLGPGLLSSLNSVGDIGGDVAGMVVSTGRTLKLAAGGMVAAQNFARAQASDPYVWGGVGPNGFDCSGLVGAVAAVAQGKSNPYRRFFTTASNFAALGWKRGIGALTMGVNPYTHMAGNVGGLPFEAASTRLGIRVGGAASPVRSFAQQWYLPGAGGFTMGPRELRQLMAAVRINWGVPSAGRVQTFDRGGWLSPGRTMAINNTGSAERVGPVALSPKTIKALGEAMGRVVLSGLGAANVRSARSADLYARAG